MNHLLQTLLSRPDVWQASRSPAANEDAGVLPSGHAVLDQALYRGGWPRAALTEVLGNDWGIGEMQLLAPALAHCSRSPRRLFFVCPPHLPYAPALLAQGVRLERLLIVRAKREHDALWCTEQILRSGAAACLLAWLPESLPEDYRALRRLQLAAHGSPGPAFLFRPPRMAQRPSPAALRIVLRGAREHLAIDIVKQRGGFTDRQLVLARARPLLQPHIDPALLPAAPPAALQGATGAPGRTVEHAQDVPPASPPARLDELRGKHVPAPASAVRH